MKKFRGTKFAKIGTTYTPLLDTEIAKVEAAILDQQARLNEIALTMWGLVGEDLDLTNWGE